MSEFKAYRVWDASVRGFHWINFACVLGLIAVGLVILNDKALGMTNDGKILLKTAHVYIGYVFAAPGVDPATLALYAPEMYDKTKFDAMREFRSPFIEVHEIGFYTLLVVALAHIVAAVVTELREGGNLVSAMISGKKVLSVKPADEGKV